MMAINDEIRWMLLGSNVKDGSFTVMDNRAKKKRTYHVPNLSHVEVSNHIAFIFTSNSKTMQLDMNTGERRFLCVDELKKMIEIKPPCNTLYLKNKYAFALKKSFA